MNIKIITFITFIMINPFIHANTISIITSENNPPYSFTLPDQTITGLYIDFWQLWSKHNAHNINITVDSIENALLRVRKKNVIYSGDLKNKDFSKSVIYSTPIHSIETGILYSRKYNRTTQLQEIHNANIAIYKRNDLLETIKKRYPNINISVISDSDKTMNQLINSDIDGLIADVPFINSELSKHKLNGVLNLSNEIIKHNTVHAFTGISNQDLLNKINEGIKNIPINEIIELEKKWLPTIEPFHKTKQQISFLTHEEMIWLKSNNIFSLGIDTSWYPFDFIDEKEQFSGIAADYIQFISESLNVNFIPEYKYKWTESFKLFKQGKIDVMSGVIATDERRKTINFTQSYFKAPTVIVNKKDSFYIGNINDLVGKKLGLVKGFAIVELVKNDFPEIQIELVDTIVEGLESVQNGKIDAYLGTLAVINHEIDSQDFDNIQIASFSPYKFEISMAVRKGLEPLVPILNKALDSMNEKQKASIANDWLAVHIFTGTNISTILIWSIPIVSILLIIILLISRYNKKLQNQIQQRQIAEKELQHLANHDSLTGLSNWRNFEKQFVKYKQENKKHSSAILFIDLDDFKSINDSLGHAAGDIVLKEVARLISMCVKNYGLLARIGGDEFIVLIYQVENLKSVKTICQSIINSISKPYYYSSLKVNIGASIGVAICPDHSKDLETLVRLADEAMYRAKGIGKNNFHLHSNNY